MGKELCLKIVDCTRPTDFSHHCSSIDLIIINAEACFSCFKTVLQMQFSSCFFERQALKIRREVEIWSHVVLTWAIGGHEWLASYPRHFSRIRLCRTVVPCWALDWIVSQGRSGHWWRETFLRLPGIEPRFTILQYSHWLSSPGSEPVL
jgi:hypothetical protein